MMGFFETIYCWFQGLFGVDLADYLAGFDCATSTFIGIYRFNTIGFGTLIIVAALAAVYYYVINSPRFSQWYHWLIWGCLTGFANLLFGGLYTSYFYNEGIIGDCFNVGIIDCWMFGVANFIVSFAIYFVISLLIKWKSTNCRCTPFMLRKK